MYQNNYNHNVYTSYDLFAENLCKRSCNIFIKETKISFLAVSSFRGGGRVVLSERPIMVFSPLTHKHGEARVQFTDFMLSLAHLQTSQSPI